MFCPACGIYMQEPDIIKMDVLATDNGVPLVYNAYCPACMTELGRMNWGVLRLHPELVQSGKPEPAEEKAILRLVKVEKFPVVEVRKSPFRIEPLTEEEVRAKKQEPFPGKFFPYESYVSKMLTHCPHCGKPLPDQT